MPPSRKPLPASVEPWLGHWIANAASAPISGAARLGMMAALLGKMASLLPKVSDQTADASVRWRDEAANRSPAEDIARPLQQEESTTEEPPPESGKGPLSELKP